MNDDRVLLDIQMAQLDCKIMLARLNKLQHFFQSARSGLVFTPSSKSKDCKGGNVHGNKR